MVRTLEARAPAGFGQVLACVEAVENYTRLQMADDFAHQLGVTRADCEATVIFIDSILKEGLLNRASGAWGVTSPFGADAKAARKHLAAARDAIAAWDGWIS